MLSTKSQAPMSALSDIAVQFYWDLQDGNIEYYISFNVVLFISNIDC